MIIGNKELIELFGTDVNKETYSKTKKVNNSLKEDLLSRAKCEYKLVIDLGRGRYEIDEKFEGEIIIPSNKMAHPIYGNLIPAILINIKNYHENGQVFCLSLNSIYAKFDMINKDNYSKMSSRRRVTSKVLDINFETLNEFFEVTHSSLKYYLENSLNFLSNINLIKVIKIPYVSLIKAETEHHKKNILDSELKQLYRRATKEEYQVILDYEEEIRKKYKIEKGNKLFGKPMIELKEKLEIHNIDFHYECYEILCMNSKEINHIVEFYGIDNLKYISENFCRNFINMTIANAEIRHNDAITMNIKDYYRFGREYVEDFMKLSNITLDTKHKSIFVPTYKVDTFQDDKGGLTMGITKLN